MRQAIGIIRKVDDLGRLVLPKELRDNMNLPVGTPMEFFADDDSIVIRRYSPGCTECGVQEEMLYGKAKICKSCAAKIAEQ